MPPVGESVVTGSVYRHGITFGVEKRISFAVGVYRNDIGARLGGGFRLEVYVGPGVLIAVVVIDVGYIESLQHSVRHIIVVGVGVGDYQVVQAVIAKNFADVGDHFVLISLRIGIGGGAGARVYHHRSAVVKQE